ncbi:MAG: iron-containing alcohol dehydrogenase [Thermoanaerobaculia bacterium]
MGNPEVWVTDQLTAVRLGNTVVWTIDGVRDAVSAILPFPIVESLQPPAANVATLIVVGGGTLIDEVKVWRRANRPDLRLVAIPTVWGSGAEASPVAVLNRDGEKVVTVGDDLLPDVRVVVEALMETLAPRRVLDACGDTWAHALEGFLSPLATDALRNELASLISELAAMPLEADVRWFELSARACAAQARSSVGLIHGIAHTLEGPLRTEVPELDAGHARLCATFTWPVMSLNRSRSTTWDDLAARHGIETDRVFRAIEQLYDQGFFDATLPSLAAAWKTVLRDPCSRTNGTLVKMNDLEWFTSKAFL